MKKIHIDKKKILIILIVLFGIYNAIWSIIINDIYSPVQDFLDGKEYITDEEYYSYSLSKPYYLQYTGNLAVTDKDGNYVLLIWPVVFGEDEYGVLINGDKETYSVYVDKFMKAKDPREQHIIDENKAQVEKLFEKANKFWDINKE
ncbi:MAG: hypothetical protein RR343_04735 [Oscillospiraceae bacterium]